MWEYNYAYDSDELYHHGILGMKWGIRRYQKRDGSLTDAGKKRSEKKLKYAEEYLGRKTSAMDGFREDGLDISKKRLKKVKQYDEQEKQYNAVKKKGDPSFTYVNGFDLEYGSLNRKEIGRIIKKMSKDPSLDVVKAMDKAYKIKRGKQVVSRVLKASVIATTANLISSGKGAELVSKGAELISNGGKSIKDLWDSQFESILMDTSGKVIRKFRR